MSKKGGFGFCSFSGHVYVHLEQMESGKYTVRIDHYRSSEFESTSAEAVWAAVKEVE